LLERREARAKQYCIVRAFHPHGVAKREDHLAGSAAAGVNSSLWTCIKR